MYEYTDKIIQYLNKRFVRIFSRAKAVVSLDELNILQNTHSMYAELEKITEETVLKMAQYYYLKFSKNSLDTITAAWLLGILKDYDPVTKYVYLHEVERKCSRLAESIIASNTPQKEIDTALRYWSAMVSQYAIEITDKAVLQAYKDDGVEQVIWITSLDEKVCKECSKREGQLYDIDDIPPKPHIGCRCYVRAYPWED